MFGTLKVQSFILTEVSDCGLLIVIMSSTFPKRKDMLKEKRQSAAQSIYIDQMYFVHLYGLHVYCALVHLDASGPVALEVSVLHLGSQQVPK